MADSTQSGSGGTAATVINYVKKEVVPAYNSVASVVGDVLHFRPIGEKSPASAPATAPSPAATTTAPETEKPKGLLEKGKDLLHKAEEKAAPLVKKAEEAVGVDGDEKEGGFFGIMKKGFGAITSMFTDDGFSMVGLLVAAVLLVVGLSSMFGGGGGAGLGLVKAVATGAGALLLGKQVVGAYREHSASQSTPGGQSSSTPAQEKTPAITLEGVTKGLAPEKVVALRKEGMDQYAQMPDVLKTAVVSGATHLQETQHLDQKTAIAITSAYLANADLWEKQHPVQASQNDSIQQRTHKALDSLVAELSKNPQALDTIKNATTRDDAVAAATRAIAPEKYHADTVLGTAGVADSIANDITTARSSAQATADALIERAKGKASVSGGTTVTAPQSQAPVATVPKDNHIDLNP